MQKQAEAAEAQRLRAAKNRRNARKAKSRPDSLEGFLDEPVDPLTGLIGEVRYGLTNAVDEQAATFAWQPVTHGNAVPGRGEIVGGEMAKKAELLMDLARKKGANASEIQEMLTHMEWTAKRQATAEAELIAHKKRTELMQELRDKVVCGFIAEVERTKVGRPPDQVIAVNMNTVDMIIAALSEAGYYAHGKRR